MRRIGLKNCPYCGSPEVYISTPKTSWEKLPALFLLKLVRCHTCMRRHFRPLLAPAAKDRERYKVTAKPAEAISTNTKNVQPRDCGCKQALTSTTLMFLVFCLFFSKSKRRKSVGAFGHPWGAGQPTLSLMN